MTRKTLIAATLAATLLAAGGFAIAQSKMMNHDGMEHGQMEGMMMQSVPENATEATKAFIAANDRMHTDMAITYSDNADVDFAKGMIPHHQGAIDMAKIVLEHGSDPEIRKLAEEIIAAQEGEIAWMQAWLAKNAK